MSYIVAQTKEQSLSQFRILKTAFEQQYAAFSSNTYNEEQLRNDFLNPMLKTLGWDIDNENHKSQFSRDVLQEEPIDVVEDDITSKRNPDYTFRVSGQKKFFVEAKKVSIDLDNSAASAYQIRRYGWNAKMGVSILTNFKRLIIYDCRQRPQSTDHVSVCRNKTFDIQNLERDFEEIYNLLSFSAVSAGSIETYFSLSTPDSVPFDSYFLTQIETWRDELATNLLSKNAGLSEQELNFLIQRLLNRIIFLRICEDRTIERSETLIAVRDYASLKALFVQADAKYNAGLFDFIEDTLSERIEIDAEILIKIFAELYYPESPYDFSIIDPSILSQIYEQYLGKTVKIDAEGRPDIMMQPEVSASNGVVPTPKLIVDSIVQETLCPSLENKSVNELSVLKFADICCGSGTFLISTYDAVAKKNIELLSATSPIDNSLITSRFDGTFSLTLRQKQKILKGNIFGVDINPYAVEVTKFSLFLKLLEGETSSSIQEFISTTGDKILPNLEENIKNGNSLIDDVYFNFDPDAVHNLAKLDELKPFNWNEEFPFLLKRGFDAIIGNPPFVRIQNMKRYIPAEIKYYQSSISGYAVAATGIFDKYFLFVQRAIQLICNDGRVGYIVPNKFFILKGGDSLRRYIRLNSSIASIIHFGVTQVFPGKSTYTAILVIIKGVIDQFPFRRISKLHSLAIRGTDDLTYYKNADYSDSPWIFLTTRMAELFLRMAQQNTVQLKHIAKANVGLQTSADNIYTVYPTRTADNTFFFTSIENNVEYEIEKSICKLCIDDLSFEAFDTVHGNAYIIFPYAIVKQNAEVLDEQTLQQQYPLAWIYLNVFKAKLEKRSINSHNPKWYEYGRSQSLTKFIASEKLIWPTLSIEPKYVFDAAHLLFKGGGNGPYYALIKSQNSYSLMYILGILVHPLFEEMIKVSASEFRGAYYSHGKQFIERLPIKQIDFNNSEEKSKHDDIVQIVALLIAAKSAVNNATISHVKAVRKRAYDRALGQLVGKVNSLYGITQEDMQTISREQLTTREETDDEN